MRRFAVCTALFVVSAAVAGATPARATFPGSNGRIAFSTDWTPPSQIYTIRPDGSGLRQLTHIAEGKGATSPSWNPDGTELAFAMDRHIWTMKADGSEKTRLANQHGFRDRHPSWSPDGTKIVFSHCDVSLGFKAYCDIDVMDADGRNEATLLAGNWMYDWPRYSPDGTKIAFASDRGGYVCAVWVADADGSDPVRLTDPALQANVPDWSPDGTKIAFSSHCELPGSKLWTMDADGSNQQELISAEGDWGSPRFAPDGSMIAVAGTDIFFVDTDGTDLREIAHPQSGVVSLDWAAKPAA
jgi:Tol biopolymer transport system component